MFKRIWFYLTVLFFLLPSLAEGWQKYRPVDLEAFRSAKEDSKRSPKKSLEEFVKPSNLIAIQWKNPNNKWNNEEALQKGFKLVQSLLNLTSIDIYESLENMAEPIEEKEKILTFKMDERVAWIEKVYVRNYRKYQNWNGEPGFGSQWHLLNSGQNGGTPGADVNIIPAWQNSITGKGIQICVVDDGLDVAHPDFSTKWVAEDSYDALTKTPSPTPKIADDMHGTSCAGVAAANNGDATCGVGSAWGASLAAVRAISNQGISDADLAGAITFHNQNNDIFSCSWGIPACQQTGQTNPAYQCTLVPISNVMLAGIQDAVKNGRGGLGNIYVFAAGNSREERSDVNYQDIPRQPEVMPIAACTNQEQVSFYSDPGASLHVAAYSNGGTLGIYTSDRVGTPGYSATSCTNSFGGTSSATPLVAGVIALMLQANPKLTWRDVQDILAKTARKIDPSNPGWQVNKAGLHVSHDFGFGVVDTNAAVTAAQKLKKHLTCRATRTTPVMIVNQNIPDNNANGISSVIEVKKGKDEKPELETIEHTIVTVTITHPYRGDLSIELTSPSGVKSVLAVPRLDPGNDYQSWAFLTRFHWGEEAVGKWTLKVADNANTDTGSLVSWSLTFYGKCPSGLSSGAIAAIVIVVLLVTFGAAFGIFFFIRHRKGLPMIPSKAEVKGVFKK